MEKVLKEAMRLRDALDDVLNDKLNGESSAEDVRRLRRLLIKFSKLEAQFSYVDS